MIALTVALVISALTTVAWLIILTMGRNSRYVLIYAILLGLSLATTAAAAMFAAIDPSGGMGI
jgi:hypothetical protein